MVNELPCGCFDGATENVAAAGVRDTFIALLVLLFSESEGHGRGCFNFSVRSRRIGEATVMKMEGDIFK